MGIDPLGAAVAAGHADRVAERTLDLERGAEALAGTLVSVLAELDPAHGLPHLGDRAGVPELAQQLLGDQQIGRAHV